MSGPQVIQRPGLGNVLADQLDRLSQVLMTTEQMRQERTQRALQARVSEANIAQSQQETAESRHRVQRQDEQDRAARAAQQEQQRALRSFLGGLPENLRMPVGALVQVGDALPAEVRTDIFKRLAGSADVDHTAYNRWLSTWRTGAVTAQQAASAVGIPLPTGIRPDQRVPTAITTFGSNTLLGGQVNRLSSRLTALQGIINDYQQEEQRTYERMGRQQYGARWGRVTLGQSESAILQNRVSQRLRTRFPDINGKFQEREQISRQLDQLTTTGTVTREPDELDQYIDRNP